MTRGVVTRLQLIRLVPNDTSPIWEIPGRQRQIKAGASVARWRLTSSLLLAHTPSLVGYDAVASCWWSRHELPSIAGGRSARWLSDDNSNQVLMRVLDMGPTSGPGQFKEPFRDEFVRFLKAVLQAFARTTPGYAHDKRSRWAYAFNPLPEGDKERPVYATMAALRAPNFAALRVGVTEGGQVVVEVEYRRLVIPYITNDVENPAEFPKIQKGLRQIIEHFERMAGIARHDLFNRLASDPDYRELAAQRLVDARTG
jgi:hypothetical protein